MSKTRLTPKIIKFARALVDSCKEPGDLSTADVEAASRIAGYSQPNQGYKMVTQSGVIKHAALQGEVDRLLGEAEPAPQIDSTGLNDIEFTLEELKLIRSDPKATAGARVRAGELILKYYGVDKPPPADDEDEADPEEALRHMAILLGVDGDVDPFTYGSR